MIRELNAVGLTASGGTCPDEFVPIFRQWAREGRLNKRFFCLVSLTIGPNAEGVTKALPQLANFKLFQGDNWVDHFAYGENLYGPANDSMVAAKATATEAAFVQWGRIIREIANAGLPLHSHTTLEGTFDGFLTQIEQVNKEFPAETYGGRSFMTSRSQRHSWSITGCMGTGRSKCPTSDSSRTAVLSGAWARMRLR